MKKYGMTQVKRTEEPVDVQDEPVVVTTGSILKQRYDGQQRTKTSFELW